MWVARILSASTALLATAAVAAPGDAWVVTGEVVNVRAGPGTRNPVLFHAYRDQRVVELTRVDDWVEVNIPGQATDGWIHQSLLQVVERAAPAAPQAPEPAPQALPEGSADMDTAAVPRLELGTAPSGQTIEPALPVSESEALAHFRGNVHELNARALEVAGVELFTGAEPTDDGAIRVLVTEAWDLVPQAGQTSYTNALFEWWRAAVGGSGPLRVQVVDPSGTVVNEKSGSGTL
jgi:SH3-like domain-containing protein